MSIPDSRLKVIYLYTRSSNGTTTFHTLTSAQRGLADEVIYYFTTFTATGESKALSTNLEYGSLEWPAHMSGKRIVFRAEGGGTGTTQGTPGGSYVEELDEAETERCKVWNSMLDDMEA